MNNSVIDLKQRNQLLNLTTGIVTAYVSNNDVSSDELPTVITSVYSTLQTLENNGAATEETKPAVPINKSYTKDYLVCLEDGKKLRMLKRYLRSQYNMTPEEYKEKWGLPSDYPMVAPAYSAKRSAFAKQIGLGTKKKA